MSTTPQTKDASTTLPATMPAAMRSIVDIAEAIMIDLPIAATKRVLARTDERELNEAGWKAYDAIVKVANDATSRVYTNSAFGRVASGAMEFAVRAQRLNAALSSAIFANLWPAIGLPTFERCRRDARGSHCPARRPGRRPRRQRRPRDRDRDAGSSARAA